MAGLEDVFGQALGLVVQRHEAVGAGVPVPGQALKDLRDPFKGSSKRSSSMYVWFI